MKLSKKITTALNQNGSNFSLETQNPSPAAMSASNENDEWKQFLFEVISNDPIYWDNWKDYGQTDIEKGMPYGAHVGSEATPAMQASKSNSRRKKSGLDL